MELVISAHAATRARQRNIHPDLIPLVVDEGRPLSRNEDRLLLNRRDIRRLKQDKKIDPRLLQRAEKSVPLVCVLVGNTVRTIFRPTKNINRSY
ncbi:hypothetical protein KAI87_17210 [Myxococcota bacterium]|nr:hypothetical protein [Myxococcota bacterium]